MQYTYYGHSSFLFDFGSTRILLDPFISPNPLASSIDVNQIECDYIFLSHGHSDHVADAEAIGLRCNATVVGAYEVAAYYGNRGLKYHPMNIGGQWDFGTFQVKLVNAVHSSVLPDGTYAGNPVGFIFTVNGQQFYYSGDTALTMDMQLIGQRFNIDRAFVCIGDNFTMGPEDALTACEFAGTKRATAMHFDTFPYVKINHDKSQSMFQHKGIELTLPEIGQSYPF
jgi:L-ascorbate metabolism protein UlaG (beta-lactamase superfamily)